MRLYRTRDGVARRNGDDLVLLELPGHDVIPALTDRIDLAREAPDRARISLADADRAARRRAQPRRLRR
jgi:hypothetical protein